MVLPEGSTVPPAPHLLALAAAVAAVGAGLWRERPAVTEGAVVALAPWMVVGASLHVVQRIGAAPVTVAPFLGTPAVYLTTAVVAGATWLAARRWSSRPTRALGGVGTALAALAVVGTLAVGGVVRAAVPLGALVVGVALGVGTWRVLLAVRPDETATSGTVGLLVLLAHALDAVSTAAGVDVLGFGERTPASRAIMDVAAGLPTADVVGVGWLFVLVKLAVAAAVVVFFADYVREAPSRAYAMLGFVAALGLGPGAHNLLLFAVAAG